MSRALRHEPKLTEANEECVANAITVLLQLKKLNEKRDRFVHGLPVISMKRDLSTKEVLRNGFYLIQTRKLDEKQRYLKVPEAAEAFLAELEQGYEQLLRVAKPMLFEDWERLWGVQP